MSAALVIVLMIVVLIAVLATYTLSRIRSSGDDSTGTVERLQRAAGALEAYAGGRQRLPCPADPSLDTGDEVRAAPASATCSFLQGTVPWRTIGMKREDAYDNWGRKLSYRVYTGDVTTGGLTQDFGVSMVYCDTDEPPPGGATTPAANGLGGLCKDYQGVDVFARNTRPESFLAGKGLSLTDMGVNYSDVAYVVLSHGPTGVGGYTVSGAAPTVLPNAAAERNNTKASGPFTIKAFSDVDTSAASGQHFDDILAYRRLPDLIRRINLWARVWPETPIAGDMHFDAPTVSAAAGRSVGPGGLGQNTLSFTSGQVSGRTGAGVASEISFGLVGDYGGLGIAGGGSSLIQSSANEYLQIDFTDTGQKFGVTLGDFGYYGAFTDEFVQFNFYKDGTAVGTFFGFGCNVDGGLASFSMDVGADYNRVDIVALPAVDLVFGTPGNITAFLVSEVRTCPAAAPSCRTSLDLPANRCF